MFEHWHLIRRLFPYMRPYKGRAVGLVVLTIVATVVGLFQPWPLAFMIDSVLGDKPYPGFLGFLTDAGVTVQILFTVLVGFAFVAVSQAIGVATRAVDTRLELGMVLDFRSDLFEHIQKLSFQYHDQAAAGRFIYQINYFAHDAGTIPTSMLPLAQAGLTLVGMFFITYQLDPQLALAALVVVPFVYVATMYYGKRIEPQLVQVRDLEGQSMSIVHEKISIVRVVVSFCRERYELQQFREQGAIALDARVRITIRQTVFALGVAVITAAGTALVLFIGAHAVRNDDLTVGQLLVVLAYVAAVYQPIEQISNSLAALQQQLIQMEMVFAVLDAEPEVKERPDAIVLSDVRGRIEVEAATFSYDTRERTIEDISFTVAPGEFVAIVGPTGAGKSTLVSLIPRFIDPSQGRVLIDGHDVRDLTLESVRGAVSVVMQEPILFMGTIADNIRYGRLDATNDEVVAAATAANAHEFILQLPQGYETTVGERGTRVSGGERQRIAVARAFLKDAPILVLDEPTSSIDSRTEAVILDALERLAEGRSTILIAHRLSTIRRADRILVVDDGRLVEQGTHDELIAAGGMYQSLWHTQSGAQRQPTTAGELTVGDASASTALANRRPKVVVLGMMSKIPVAGVVWQTMHYLVGLERLGIDAYYVESHARTPSMLMKSETDDASKAAAGFIADAMDRFGLSGRWAFHALHDDGAVYGMTAEQLNRLYADADLIINLHGGTEPLAEHSAAGRLVYLETDPVQLQIELAENNQVTLDFLEPHVAFFTFGENYARPSCGLPVSERFEFMPTRQPVVNDFWATYGHGSQEAFTTIGNWRQPWREVSFNGETYHWTKHLEFLKFLDVPRRTGAQFELALSSYTDDDKAMLESYGWQVTHALDLSIGLDSYRRYIGSSRGEFTVAKDQNVRLRTGWFSDRSATYLAAGRPVITQDTGFGEILPTGEGLFAFSTLDDVAAAVEAVNGDYARHRRAARMIAREYFDSDVVLRPLLEACGMELPRTHMHAATPLDVHGPLVSELDLRVVGRHPTTLSDDTVAAIAAAGPVMLPMATEPNAPRVSIVIATYDNLMFTQLCLAAVVANTGRDDYEIVVVDNGSTDATVAYVGDLGDRSPLVRLIRNDTNRGFAAAVNQGVAASAGELIVLLNNDTLVAPGWLERLEAHLDEPDVGMVGPLTNEAPNEARTTIAYTTYGGFLEAAADHITHDAGDSFDIDVLTMFCVMFRRSTYQEVGPLDEQFEIGMFEDDDYAIRLRELGLRSVCAADVLVHHFGEATIGKLVAGGDYSQVFDANRRRFEEKWDRTWTSHQARPDAVYLEVVNAVVAATGAAVPTGATVLMVSKGDERLLDVDGRTVKHFPCDDDGTYVGWYRSSTSEVLADIEHEFTLGATHIVFPTPSAWWFEFYDGLADALGVHLDELDGAGACRIFAVRDTAHRHGSDHDTNGMHHPNMDHVAERAST